MWPTHGAGSFCSAPAGTERTSTIGTERATNTLHRAESEDAFVKQLLDSLGTFPPYFLRLGEVNRRGPALVDAGSPIIVVRNADQDPAEILWQARKIGYDQIAGELEGGVTSWSSSGQPTMSIPIVDPGEVGSSPVLDIRQDNEFEAGHLPAARHVELGALPGEASKVPIGPTVLMCGHSERAMGAASLLARAGRSDISVLDGGPQDWADATGVSLEVGA